MNHTNRLALAAALAFSALAAQAGQDFGNNQYPPEAVSQSTLTRAEVVADFKTNKAAGQLPSDQHYANYPEYDQTQTSTVTRAQVRDDAVAAMKDGGLSFGS